MAGDDPDASETDKPDVLTHVSVAVERMKEDGKERSLHRLRRRETSPGGWRGKGAVRVRSVEDSEHGEWSDREKGRGRWRCSVGA